MNARKAIVLAAGFGSRLVPFTRTVPKPLMPVWGVSMLERIVQMLRDWGVDDIVVNAHHLHEQVEAWARKEGCKVSHESEILGTGGVLNPLRGWIGDDPFYLVNADIAVGGIDDCPFSLDRNDDSVIAQCLVTGEGPCTIEVEPESGFVTCWDSPDKGFPGTFTYSGVALLRPSILDYVEPSGFSSIVQAYGRAMMEGRFVKAIAPDGFLWADAGTVESYIALNSDGADNSFAEIPHIAAAIEAAGLCDPKVRFLSVRGSDRCFFALGESAIAAVYDDEKRPENARYASHARFLAEKGINVPAILADVGRFKTLVMECAGSERKMTLDDYTRVVGHLAKFNSLDVSALDLEPPFDSDLYAWEHGLFEEHCLKRRYGIELSAEAKRELSDVASALLEEPLELVHRDFQSSNILWKGTGFSFIDFQGMRRGAALYDLASLLYDPYASLSERERSLLAAYYAKERGLGDISGTLAKAAVQRLVQALGAYGRLASVGQKGFLRHIPKALENLLAAADACGLDAIGALAEDLIAREEHLKKHGEAHA